VDFFYANSHVFYRLKQAGKAMGVAQMQNVDGKVTSRSEIFVRHDSDVKPVFTRNLSNSIHQVLLGDVDAATMCGVNFKLMSRKLDTRELKVIGYTDVYPENLIGARQGLDPALVMRFRQAVITMPETARGRQVLETMRRMKIKRFVPYDPAIERITRNLLEQSHLE